MRSKDRSHHSELETACRLLKDWDECLGKGNAEELLKWWVSSEERKEFVKLQESLEQQRKFLKHALDENDVFDCFQIARWQPNENRLSDVLAAVFDPAWGHGYWLPVLRELLSSQELSGSTPAKEILRILQDAHQPRPTVRRETHGADSRADIDIIHEKFVIRIEHKMRGGTETLHKSGKPQTTRLLGNLKKDHSDKKLLALFVSPEGSFGTEKEFMRLSFHSLSQCIGRAIQKELGLSKAIPPAAASILGFAKYYGGAL